MTDTATQSLLQRAIAARANRDLAGAMALCEQVRASDRRNLLAIDLLAQLCYETGDQTRSLALLAEGVKAHPKNARMRTNLGRGYARDGRFREAVVQFDQALKLDPGHAPALAGKANVFTKQDRYDRARRALSSCLDGAAPPPPEIGWICLHVLIHDGDYDDAIRLGRRILGADPEPNDAVRQTWFELARAQERAGDHEGALATAMKANAILAPPYDAEQTRRQFDQLIDVFSKERMAQIPRSDDDRSEAPIFVFGLPRSGTTLVERILHAHSAAHGIGESGILPQLARTLPQRIGADAPYPACVADFTADNVRDVGQWYLDETRRFDPKAERVVDKDLGTHRYLGLVSVILPRGRFVWCRRALVDTCLSCFMEPLMPSSHPYASDLRHLGAFAREFERLMAHWTATLALPVHEIEYEKLVADQEAESRRLLEFCGLPWDDRCLRQHEVKRADGTLSFDQVRKPVYKSSVGRAERFGALLDPLREALAGVEGAEHGGGGGRGVD